MVSLASEASTTVNHVQSVKAWNDLFGRFFQYLCFDCDGFLAVPNVLTEVNTESRPRACETFLSI